MWYLPRLSSFRGNTEKDVTVVDIHVYIPGFYLLGEVGGKLLPLIAQLPPQMICQ